jgi:hypothetical protein
MKSLVWKVSGIAVIIALICLLISYVNGLRNEVKIAEQNRLAAIELYNDEQNTTYALRVQVDDLDRIRNAQIREMDSIRHELKVKDKHLKALYGSKSSADIHDTIEIPIPVYLKDSIDSIGDYCVDTCIGDMRWYNICIERVDSNLVALSAHFESDLTLIAVEKKEVVDKPRKTAFGRFLQKLFSKKVKTMSITAIEQNPYVKNDSTMFVIPVK